MNFLHNSSAIFQKQCKEVIQDKMFIFTFFMFPLLSFLFRMVMPKDVLEMTLPLFFTMHMIMMPILNMASIIGEEKEKNTLRVLLFANVKPMEYLCGIGLCVVLIAMFSTSLFIPVFSYTGVNIAKFLLISFCGNLCSIIIGGIVGLLIKNQVNVGTIASPIGILFGMMPMFSNFNQSVYEVTKFFYSQVIFSMVGDLSVNYTVAKFGVIGGNLTILFLIFCIVYRRKKLSY